MKKKSWIIILGIALLLACGIWFFAFREKEKPLTVVAESPHYGSISLNVTATGTVQPVDTVAVGTQVSGTIQKIFVDFNSVVKKGQLLAQLDQSLLNAQVQQFAANVQQAQSNLIYLDENFKRQSELYKVGAISKADYENAANLYRAAGDNVNSIQAQLSSAKKNLSFTNIISPINGTVLSRNISEGQTVAASFNTPTLFSIAKDLTKMQVRASVDEADIGNVKQGERATFTVDAFPNDTFNGNVEEVRLEPSVSANVVTYTTIINAPNDDLKLKPGMTANIAIYTREQDNTMLIPATAIKFSPDSTLKKSFVIETQDDPGKSIREGKHNTSMSADSANVKMETVWVERGDTLLQKKIKTGLDDEVNVQVLSGLSPMDKVVTGTVSGAAKDNAAKSENASPFMPHRSSQKPSGASKKSS